MATQQVVPAPPLDTNPPSPPGLSAGAPSSLSQLSPGTQLSGTLQQSQLVLQAGAEAAKLIDLIGQINPNFAPTAQMIISQLRGGLRTILQQGSQGSEPTSSPLGMMGGGAGAAAPAGPAQVPPPMLPSGMQ